MRRYLLVAISATAVSPGAAAQNDEPASIRIITGDAARGLFTPCTRDGPVLVDSVWDPDSESLRPMLSYLPFVLPLQAPDPGGGLPTSLRDYHAMFAGFYRSGERWIYGSFVDTASASVASQSSGSPMVPCDGGWRFWGAEWNADTDTLGPIQRNASGLLMARDSLYSAQLVVVAQRLAAVADSAHLLYLQAAARQGVVLTHGPGPLYGSVAEAARRAVMLDGRNALARVVLADALLVLGEGEDEGACVEPRKRNEAQNEARHGVELARRLGHADALHRGQEVLLRIQRSLACP